MRRIAVFLLVVITSVGVTYADEWIPLTERDFFSESGQFVAHVIPAKEKEKPMLELFEIKDTQRVFIWQCKLGNEKGPVGVYVSNAGEYVVTCNEWGKTGYGDYVVAFYNKEGLIKNYSLEEILHLPKDVKPANLWDVIPYSAGSRGWDTHSIKFFDTYGGKLYFCVWLHFFDRWMAWNPADGEEVKVDSEMVKNWNLKGRFWALKEIERGTVYYYTPYEFLGKLKNPADRPILEGLLSDDEFVESGRKSQGKHLIRYNASSRKRLLAEKILADWDGRPTDKYANLSQPLYYLGKLEGVVSLPRIDDPNRATLWIYLVSSTMPKDQWYKQPPVQRLAVFFRNYSFRDYGLEYTLKFPFGVQGVTPGEYWIKAVLDRTEPLSKEDDKFYLSQKGDYQNIESPIFAIKAGETIQDLSIDCTYKVTDGNN